MDLPAMLADLRELVTCESPSDDRAAVARSAEVLAAVGHRRLGVEPERIVLDGRTHLRWRFGDGPSRVLLLGHHDTVWPLGSLARHPYEVAGELLRGPGCFDMKAGVVAIVAALAAIRAAGARLRGQVSAHFVVSEEDGGLGAFGTLLRGYTGDACIITEPTSGALMTANAGALTFRIDVPGQATHGSTRYAGVSAIDAYLPIHRALARLEARRNTGADPLMSDYPIPYPLSVGTVHSGVVL